MAFSVEIIVPPAVASSPLSRSFGGGGNPGVAGLVNFPVGETVVVEPVDGLGESVVLPDAPEFVGLVVVVDGPAVPLEDDDEAVFAPSVLEVPLFGVLVLGSVGGLGLLLLAGVPVLELPAPLPPPICGPDTAGGEDSLGLLA